MTPAPTYLALPPPISTNNLFLNMARGRRVSPEYAAWKRSADEYLRLQSAPRFMQRASVALFVGTGGVGQMDADNTAKAYLDALVRAGAIANDNRKHIASVNIAWVDGMRGCIAEIAAARHNPSLRGFYAALNAEGRQLVDMDFAREVLG